MATDKPSIKKLKARVVRLKVCFRLERAFRSAAQYMYVRSCQPQFYCSGLQ